MTDTAADTAKELYRVTRQIAKAEAILKELYKKSAELLGELGG